MTIDLKETNTKKYNSENLIQINARTNFKKLIIKLLKDIQSEEVGFNRVHNTILINGKRGMGKTSFILSMQDDQEIMNNLCPLDIIDPTLIETKEHVFLNIITSIKDKVKNYVECEQNCLNDDSLKNWKNSLFKLAGGLSMLDGVGSNHLQDSMWDSPELILEKGLSNSKQGKELERDFHEFIKISLKVIKKDAFFLILDDIDTSLEKGVSILETLRKYLTSNRLIITMLGDIDLYSILVRQLQWEKLDPKKILKDYEGKDKYITQIDHLEEQYLTKVLKPENRIDLDNLLDLKGEINIVSTTTESALSLDKFLSELIKDIYLAKDNTYKKYYSETILTQSTRSVIQILKLFDEKRDFTQVLKNTFYTTLKKKLERYNLLDIHKKEQFLNLLSIYILKTNVGRDNHLKLIPDFTDNDNNVTMLYLNSFSNSILKDSKNYLDYFIKVGYALEQFLGLENKKENEIKKYIEHIAMNSGESSSKIAKRLLTTSPKINSSKSNNPILFGAIFIPYSKLRNLSAESSLPLVLSKVNSSNTGSYHFISFFNMLGFLSDISLIQSSEELNRMAITYSQILEFNSYIDSNIVGESEIIEDKDYKVNLSNEIIYSWIKKKKNIEELPLFLLSKIWVRVSSTFNNVIKNRNTFKTYYDVFEMFIVGFLNAVYVEISLYEDKNFNNKNFIKNPEKANSFYEKIKDYKLDKDNYTLFDYLIECPFFIIKENTENVKEFSMFLHLKEIEIDKEEEKINKKPKIKKDFYTLTEEEQKKILLNLDYNKFAISTISGKVRDIGYRNVADQLIEELVDKLKR